MAAANTRRPDSSNTHLAAKGFPVYATGFPQYDSWFGQHGRQILNGVYGPLEEVDPHFSALLYAETASSPRCGLRLC